MFELAHLRSGAPAARSARLEPYQRVDPDVWSFDYDTGEFHRITFTCAEGRLISTETYHQRGTKRLLLIQEIQGFAKTFWVSAVVFVVSCVIVYMSGRDINGFLALAIFALPLSFLGVVFCGLLWLCLDRKLNSAEYALGPAPIPPPGLEEVERQKIYGVGGFASRDEIDRAARGLTGTAADHATFDD
jgi:hypothetical protein